MIASRQLIFIGKVVWDPSFDRLEKLFWHQVAIIWYHNMEVAHNLKMKVLSWETIFFYSKEYTKCILILSMELWRVGSTSLAMKDIVTILFNVYYTQAKKCQPDLKRETDRGKAVGAELGWILIHIQILHHDGRKNLLFCHHHHIIEYPTLK